MRERQGSSGSPRQHGALRSSDPAMGDDDAAPVVFKKPARKANMRKRKVEADDADAGEAGEASGGPRCAEGPAQPACTPCAARAHTLRPHPPGAQRRMPRGSASLEMMKELQRQRKREKGVSLELKGTDGDAEELNPEEEARELNLDSTFTAQTDAGEVDPNMLKYIEEQMEKGEDGAAKRNAAFEADDEELFATPAHLKERLKSDVNLTEAEDAGRWLAGIVEVQVAPEEKMAAIEATEKAKRKLMEAKVKRGMAQGSAMDIPSNFNSNFHKHRQEGSKMIHSKGVNQGSAIPNLE